MKKAKIYYACMGESWRKEKKLAELEILGQTSNVSWQEITPDKRYTWLNEDSESDFENFIAVGSQAAKASSEDKQEVIFKLFSLGVNTNRDTWVYSFRLESLLENIEVFINTYNDQVHKWHTQKKNTDTIDAFLL
jgi:predicted helicase